MVVYVKLKQANMEVLKPLEQSLLYRYSTQERFLTKKKNS